MFAVAAAALAAASSSAFFAASASAAARAAFYRRADSSQKCCGYNAHAAYNRYSPKPHPGATCAPRTHLLSSLRRRGGRLFGGGFHSFRCLFCDLLWRRIRLPRIQECQPSAATGHPHETAHFRLSSARHSNNAPPAQRIHPSCSSSSAYSAAPSQASALPPNFSAFWTETCGVLFLNDKPGGDRRSARWTRAFGRECSGARQQVTRAQ